MTTLADGLTTSLRGVADRAGALFGKSEGEKNVQGVGTHQKPPTPEWSDARGGEGGRAPEAASYERAGGGASGTEGRDFGDGGVKGKYATSYSWDNPPPKPKSGDESEEEAERPKEKTAEELFGLDKEPSKKLLKKKAARAKEPGALHAAVARGDLIDARELIELGARVDEPKSEEDSTTPLLIAAAKGNAEMVRLLLKSGADLTARDDCENNALHLACSKGHVDVANRLIKAGCDIETRAGNGATALHLAARKGHDDVVTLLLESGMDIESVDGKGATALHAACSGGYEDVVSLLIKRGADVAAEDGKGKTPRQIASKKGHDDCAKIIKRAIKEEEANALAAKRMAEERAQRAKLKEEAETKAALEAHRLHEIEVAHPPVAADSSALEDDRENEATAPQEDAPAIAAETLERSSEPHQSDTSGS